MSRRPWTSFHGHPDWIALIEELRKQIPLVSSYDPKNHEQSIRDFAANSMQRQGYEKALAVIGIITENK